MTRAAAGLDVDQVVEHCFRHDAAAITAVLTAQFGPAMIDAVEDAVQAALAKALERWRFAGQPDNARGWLYRVARNHVIDRYRRRATGLRLADEPALHADGQVRDHAAAEAHFDAEIADSEVRLIFACCHPSVGIAGQVAMALKLMGGFSNTEIARCLMTSEDTAAKRIQRARARLRSGDIAFEMPDPQAMPARLDGVLAAIYAIFSEGYQSANPDILIRRDLCREAMRLCGVLLNNPVCDRPSARALMALMLLHGARFDARVDQSGAIILLREQDRACWNRDMIESGLALLAASAEGETVSRYHLEAGIAARHSIAATYDQTDWAGILTDYDRLLALAQDPLHAFNRCIALGEIDGPRAAIAALEAVDVVWGLRERYYLFEAALGEFNARLGDAEAAMGHYRAAYRKTSSRLEQRLLEAKINAL